MAINTLVMKRQLDNIRSYGNRKDLMAMLEDAIRDLKNEGGHKSLIAELERELDSVWNTVMELRANTQ